MYGDAGGSWEAGSPCSLAGICKDKPRKGKLLLARMGVEGQSRSRSRIELSSFDCRREASTMCGDGDSFGVPPPSDKDRVLDSGDLKMPLSDVFCSPAPTSPSLRSSSTASKPAPRNDILPCLQYPRPPVNYCADTLLMTSCGPTLRVGRYLRRHSVNGSSLSPWRVFVMDDSWILADMDFRHKGRA
jgi:hypothetical protein